MATASQPPCSPWLCRCNSAFLIPRNLPRNLPIKSTNRFYSYIRVDFVRKGGISLIIVSSKCAYSNQMRRYIQFPRQLHWCAWLRLHSPGFPSISNFSPLISLIYMNADYSRSSVSFTGWWLSLPKDEQRHGGALVSFYVICDGNLWVSGLPLVITTA